MNTYERLLTSWNEVVDLIDPQDRDETVEVPQAAIDSASDKLGVENEQVTQFTIEAADNVADNVLQALMAPPLTSTDVLRMPERLMAVGMKYGILVGIMYARLMADELREQVDPNSNDN